MAQVPDNGEAAPNTAPSQLPNISTVGAITQHPWVMINFGSGNCQTGFETITAQLWSGDGSISDQITGELPTARQLAQQYRRWQQLYGLLYGHCQDWRNSSTPISTSAFEFEPDDITNVSSAEFHRLCHSLRQGLNQWLDSEGFRKIDRQLRNQFSRTSPLRLVIAAKETEVLRLPWCLWDFLDDYPKAEVALSPPDYGRAHKLSSSIKPKVRMLAILGNPEGIDVKRDQQILEALPDVELSLLVEPSRQELDEQLWQAHWDILFFAGHSGSQTPTEALEPPLATEPTSGYLQLNRNERISVAQLKYALRQSIKTGLQLAILNSCDGLGLAWDLADLQIPQVIVMREPVPDLVAQSFLKHFLKAFSSGQSLYCAVRTAREQIYALEDIYSCASWLPVVVQNPAESPPYWRSLFQSDASQNRTCPTTTALPATPPTSASPEQHSAPGLESPGPEIPNPTIPGPTIPGPTAHTSAAAQHPTATPSIETLPPPTQKPQTSPLIDPSQSPPESSSSTSVSPSLSPKRTHVRRFPRLSSHWFSPLWVTAAILLLRWLNGLAPLERWSFDQLLRLRPTEGPDPHLLIVTIDEQDIQNQALSNRDVSLSDQSLSTLLTTLEQAGASLVGIDLYRDFPVSSDSLPLSKQLKASNIIGVCKGRDRQVDPTGIGPPPEMAAVQVGFSDFLTDDDGVLRRQLISMTPDPASICTPHYAFSSLIAFNFLNQQGIDAQFTADGHLQLGKQQLRPLRSRSGGYQSINAQGTQALLHYRALPNPLDIAQRVSLTQVLNGQLNPDAVSDRIVLIGVTAPGNGDFWATPYGSGPLEEIPGVFIHAHMVSQLISAAQEGRPFLWVWHPAIDGLWILGWASLGGFLACNAHGFSLRLLVRGTAALVSLGSVSFLLLLKGGWVPLFPALLALSFGAIATTLTIQSALSPSLQKPTFGQEKRT